MHSKQRSDSANVQSLRSAALHQFDEYERARNERDAAESRMTKFADTIATLVDMMAPEEREDFLLQSEKLRLGEPSNPRGGKVYGNVVELFKRGRRSEWSVPEIHAALEETAEAPPNPKAVYNTVAYLAKTGFLQRVSRGRYVVKDFGVALEMDTDRDDFSNRPTEHDN